MQTCLLGNRYEVLLVSYTLPTWLDCEAINEVEITDLNLDKKLTGLYTSQCSETILFHGCEGASKLYLTTRESGYVNNSFLFDFETHTLTSNVSLEECGDLHPYEDVNWK